MIIGVIGVVAVVGLLVYAVVGANSGASDELPKWRQAELDSSSLLPGVYYAPHPGPDGTPGTSDDREHFANGIKTPICTADQIAQNQISNPVCYTSNPPTSGPHAQSPMPFGVLANPAPKENLIHNMEHGGVVIWYNTTNQQIIDQLKKITEQQMDRRRLVVLSAYSEMETDYVAVTGWTRLDKFPISEFSEKRVNDFVEEHQRRFNPEGF
jgi:hypothetical protein